MTRRSNSFTSGLLSLWFTLVSIAILGAAFAELLNLASGQAQGWTFYLAWSEVAFEAAVRLVAAALAGVALGTLLTAALTPFLWHFASSRERIAAGAKSIAVTVTIFLVSWVVLNTLIGWLHLSGWRLYLVFAAFLLIFANVLSSARGRKEVTTSLDGFLGEKATRRTAMATGIGAAALVTTEFVMSRFPPTSVKAAPVARPQKPNILLITFDALGAEDLSLYGYRLPTTPNIDAFARNATVFANFYSASTFTTPAVATILSGLHPSEHHIYHLPARFRAANQGKSLPHLMRAAGYATGASISNPYAYYLADSLTGAYDVLPEPAYRTGALKSLWDASEPLHQKSSVGSRAQEYADLESAWDFVPGLLEGWSPRRFGRLQSGYPPAACFAQARDVLARLGDGFFLWVHVMAPHLPYLPDEADRGRFLASEEMRTAREQDTQKWWPLYNADQQSQVDKARLRYDEFVASADRAFGAFISQLESEGKLRGTAVIVSADHGESFEGGVYTHMTAYQTRPVVHVPLIIREPGQAGPRRVAFTADQTTLAPTILELAGQPKPAWMPGRSLVEFLSRDNQSAAEGLAFTEYFGNSRVDAPLHKGTVGVIDGRNQYVFDLATGKGNFRPLNEAHIWNRDHSAGNPRAVEAMRAAIYARFPDLPRKTV